MDKEMSALHKNRTWGLTTRPSGKQAEGYSRVYIVKHLPDGCVEHLKERLVAVGYIQTYDVDYLETFSPVARLNFVFRLFSLLQLDDHGPCINLISRMPSFMVICSAGRVLD